MYSDESSSDSTDEEQASVIKKMRYTLEESSLNENKKWEIRCFSEIPPDCLCKIIKMIHPTILLEDYEDGLNESMWKECYHSYKRWKSCVYQELSEEIILELPLLPIERHVNCTAVWKKYLAIGTAIGEIIIYDLNNPNLPPVEFKYEGKVTQMVFWKSNVNKLLLVSSSSSIEIKFWDIKSRKELTNEIPVYGSNICTGTMHNLFIESNGIIQMYECGGTDQQNRSENQKKIQLLLLSEEKIVRMSSEKDEMLLISIYTLHAKVFYLTVPTHNNPYFKLIRSSPYIELFDSEINKDSYHFHMPTLSLSIGLFNNCMGFLTTNNDNWYLNNSELGKNIRSVAMHANLLVLGLQTGEVKLFPVDDEKLFVAHIEMYWSHDIKLENDPIISLNLTEFNRKPHIIAATEKNVYMLYPARSIHNNVDENREQSQ